MTGHWIWSLCMFTNQKHSQLLQHTLTHREFEQGQTVRITQNFLSVKLAWSIGSVEAARWRPVRIGANCGPENVSIGFENKQRFVDQRPLNPALCFELFTNSYFSRERFHTLSRFYSKVWKHTHTHTRSLLHEFLFASAALPGPCGSHSWKKVLKTRRSTRRTAQTPSQVRSNQLKLPHSLVAIYLDQNRNFWPVRIFVFTASWNWFYSWTAFMFIITSMSCYLNLERNSFGPSDIIRQNVRNRLGNNLPFDDAINIEIQIICTKIIKNHSWKTFLIKNRPSAGKLPVGSKWRAGKSSPIISESRAKRIGRVSLESRGNHMNCIKNLREDDLKKKLWIKKTDNFYDRRTSL